MGPKTELAQRLHTDKYREAGESFEDCHRRVARGTADNPAHEAAFFDATVSQRFLPAGRVLAAIGSTRGITPYNCNVSGTIEDSFVDGTGSIMARATESATTMRMGCGVGYDFSTLRPRNALIKKLGSHSSGPVSFMEIYNAICLATSSAGHRRGAQMGVLRIDHPDIEEFIKAKGENDQKLTGFNLSVGVTDEFMECLRDGRPFKLRFGGEVYREVDPEVLWDKVMRQAYDWAEPGVLFIDRINEMNNLWYCETIAATNPCGEQPLPPFGMCLLGSFNLTKYLVQEGIGPAYGFDWGQLTDDIPHVVRAMDNVVDVATYPLYEQEKEAKAKRRMGLGVTGVANTGEALGLTYGTPAFCDWLDQVLDTIKVHCYAASIELAKEKGPFPAFRAEYLQSRFIETLPESLQRDIAAHGIRNSHLLSIAPTGTISIVADNVSSGIEPVFSYVQGRRVNTPNGLEVVEAPDYGQDVLGVRGRVMADVPLEDHLRVMATCIRHIDSAISKTANVPKDIPWEEFVGFYRAAWELGCKGATLYRVGCKREGILFEIEEKGEEPRTCRIDPRTGARDCD